MVTLRAQTPNGLFPADFLNQLSLSLQLHRRPYIRYVNRVPFEMHASDVTSAPPQLDMVARQFRQQDIFTLVVPIPVAPRHILIREGEQKFLTPGGLKLERLGIQGQTVRFSITNLLGEQVRVAYFAHVTDVDPSLKQRADGITDIPENGSREIAVDLGGVISTLQSAVLIYGIVLAPSHLEGYDRLEFPSPELIGASLRGGRRVRRVLARLRRVVR